MNKSVVKCKLTELNSIIKENYDIFVCSSSFETRCLSVAKNIDHANIKHALIIYLNEFIEYTLTNRTELEKIFQDKYICVETCQSDPIYSADNIKINLKKIIDGVGEICSILFDITCFTHEMLLIVLQLFHIICPNANISCIYSNAKVYDSLNEKNSKWLSKGIKEIRSVLGYSGDIIPTRQTHLIIIVGYEYERAAQIVETMEPNTLALACGHSDDATTDKDKNANEHYLQLVKQMTVAFRHIDQFDIKCDNPFATLDILSNQIADKKNKNTIIVPLNNKISTIGVAFTAMYNKNIQLCYAPALTYNYDNYSIPGDTCYVFSISDILKNIKALE